MNTFQILEVSSRFVQNPRQRQHISRQEVEAGLLTIRIFQSRHGRSRSTYHMYIGDKVSFTGKIEDIKTLVSTRRVEYTLIGGKLSGYHVFTNANIVHAA